MPADLPSAAVAVVMPHYRLVAFVLGGVITMGVLLLLTSLLDRLA